MDNQNEMDVTIEKLANETADQIMKNTDINFINLFGIETTLMLITMLINTSKAAMYRLMAYSMNKVNEVAENQQTIIDNANELINKN